MTTQQMKIQASCLAEYEQVGTPGYKAASNTAQKKIAAEYHDFLMFSAAIFNILTKNDHFLFWPNVMEVAIIRQMDGSRLGEQL